jgi:hypothetical protein
MVPLRNARRLSRALIRASVRFHDRDGIASFSIGTASFGRIFTSLGAIGEFALVEQHKRRSQCLSESRILSEQLIGRQTKVLSAPRKAEWG